MKIVFTSVVFAALTASVAGFAPPSSSLMASRSTSSVVSGTTKSFLPNTNTNTDSSSLLKGTPGDEQNLDVVVYDMLTISGFVYTFRNIRDIVRDHGATVGDGRDCKSGHDVDHGDVEVKKSMWPFSKAPKEAKRVNFYRPELIITDKGAQVNNFNRNFQYAVTPPAIAEFIANNRKFLSETDGGDFLFDETETERKGPFNFEIKWQDQLEDNMKMVDFDDSFSTDGGGLVYGLIVNLTKKWVCIVFRGTIGGTDISTDRNFVLDKSHYKSTTGGENPGTHEGFTKYMFEERECDYIKRPHIDRIIASVSDAFEKNPDIVGKDFKLYTTGHSLGGGLSNLFAFHAAQLKGKNDESVKHFPKTVTAITYAAPVIGDDAFNKEYQALEKEGVLRHIRISNEGDVVPTYKIPIPFAVKGDSSKYTQNGVNLFLRNEQQLEVDYRNTKTTMSQLQLNLMKTLNTHLLPEYEKRLNLQQNKEVFQQTIEEIYQEAGDYTK